ncbi:MAG: hypothetical protein GY915_08175 [bacterium]|nr:hypothetical protein [bacterium]
MKKKIFLLCLISGLLLIAINLSGMMIGIDRRHTFEKKTLTAQETLTQLDKSFKRHGRSIKFVEEANHLISKGTIYKWPFYDATVPFYENWILFSLGFLEKKILDPASRKESGRCAAYEFLNYEKALQRGFGICSQLAIIAADILHKRYSIDTYLIVLEGHVVTEARLEKESRILDPSADIVLPFGLEEAEKNLDIVSKTYGEKWKIFSDLYATPNRISLEPGVKAYRPKGYYFEKISYIAKWLLPILFLLFGFIGLRSTWQRKH